MSQNVADWMLPPNVVGSYVSDKSSAHYAVSVVQVQYRLPFYLPVNEKHFEFLLLPKGNKIMFTCRHIDIDVKDRSVSREFEYLHPHRYKQTDIEILLINRTEDRARRFRMSEDGCREIAIESVRVINDLVVTLMIKTNDYHVREINFRDLYKPQIGMFYSRDRVDGVSFIMSSVEVGSPLFSQQELKPEEMNEVGAALQHVAAMKSRVRNYITLLYGARRDLEYGNYNNAVISRNTSIEILFTDILQYEVVKNKGGTLESVIDEIKRRGIAGMMKRYMPEILRGKGFLNEEGTPFHLWEGQCYQQRNQIVHLGYRSNYSNARWALESSELLVNYTLLKLEKRGKKYEDLVQSTVSRNKNYTPLDSYESFFKEN